MSFHSRGLSEGLATAYSSFRLPDIAPIPVSSPRIATIQSLRDAGLLDSSTDTATGKHRHPNSTAVAISLQKLHGKLKGEGRDIILATVQHYEAMVASLQADLEDKGRLNLELDILHAELRARDEVVKRYEATLSALQHKEWQQEHRPPPGNRLDLERKDRKIAEQLAIVEQLERTSSMLQEEVEAARESTAKLEEERESAVAERDLMAAQKQKLDCDLSDARRELRDAQSSIVELQYQMQRAEERWKAKEAELVQGRRAAEERMARREAELVEEKKAAEAAARLEVAAFLETADQQRVMLERELSNKDGQLRVAEERVAKLENYVRECEERFIKAEGFKSEVTEILSKVNRLLHDQAVINVEMPQEDPSSPVAEDLTTPLDFKSAVADFEGTLRRKGKQSLRGTVEDIVRQRALVSIISTSASEYEKVLARLGGLYEGVEHVVHTLTALDSALKEIREKNPGVVPSHAEIISTVARGAVDRKEEQQGEELAKVVSGHRSQRLAAVQQRERELKSEIVLMDKNITANSSSAVPQQWRRLLNKMAHATDVAKAKWEVRKQGLLAQRKENLMKAMAIIDEEGKESGEGGGGGGLAIVSAAKPDEAPPPDSPPNVACKRGSVSEPSPASIVLAPMVATGTSKMKKRTFANQLVEAIKTYRAQRGTITSAIVPVMLTTLTEFLTDVEIHEGVELWLQSGRGKIPAAQPSGRPDKAIPASGGLPPPGGRQTRPAVEYTDEKNSSPPQLLLSGGKACGLPTLPGASAAGSAGRDFATEILGPARFVKTYALKSRRL